MTSSRRTLHAVILCAAMAVTSCNALKEAGQQGANPSPCSFKLDGISNFRFAGVSLYGKSTLDIADNTEALASFAQGVMPASFILNVVAKNANPGAEGSRQSTVTLVSLSWTLFIDSVSTIEGDIPQPMKVPGTGEQVIVPIWMKLDLLRFFKASRYEKLVDLAFALGGARGSASRVRLLAKPTIKTADGELAYPDAVEIVEEEFRGQ